MANTSQPLAAYPLTTFNRLQSVTQHFLADPVEPPLTPTPRDTVWQRGKVRLFRYRPQTSRLHPVPYLIVPWIGISRTDVLDLMPGNSFIEFLVQQGYDTYLLDWGDPEEEDGGLGFDQIALTLLPRAVDRVLYESGADDLTLNGICIGGIAAVSYLALHPDAPVRNYVSTVAPIDFEHGGMFRTWINAPNFPAELIVEQYGGIPSYLMAAGFKGIRPTQDFQSRLALWMNIENPQYVNGYKAMSRWANNYIGMPGRLFLQLAQDLYRENKLVAGDFILRGRRIELAKIRQPVLVVAAERDYVVPPLTAAALMRCVSSEDKEYMELPGGHISVFSGRQAYRTFWPRLDAWLQRRAA